LISFQVSPPKEHVNVARYQSRLDRGLSGVDPNHLPTGILIGEPGQDGEAIAFYIRGESALFPTMGEGVASMALTFIGVMIEFYNPKTDIDRLRMGFGRQPDFGISAVGNTGARNEPTMSPAMLRYELKQRRISVVSYDAPSNPNVWERTDNISSILIS
jgi:hypothetical protein